MKTLRYLPILILFLFACDKDNDPAPSGDPKMKDDSTYVILNIFSKAEISNLTLKFIKPSQKYDTITHVWTSSKLNSSTNYDSSINKFTDTLWIYKGSNQVIEVNVKNEVETQSIVTLKVSDYPYTKLLIDRTEFGSLNNTNEFSNHKFTFSIK